RDFHVTGVQTCALPIYFLTKTYGNHLLRFQYAKTPNNSNTIKHPTITIQLFVINVFIVSQKLVFTSVSGSLFVSVGVSGSVGSGVVGSVGCVTGSSSVGSSGTAFSSTILEKFVKPIVGSNGTHPCEGKNTSTHECVSLFVTSNSVLSATVSIR